MNRPIKFNRWGLAEDPVGQIARWWAGGRFYLAEIIGTYRREFPPAVMLQTRHFNGEVGPEVAASAVKLVLPDSKG